MYILITNDDGYQSEGLVALRAALSQMGEVAVVAPERNWSAAGHYRKLFDPLRAWEGALPDGSPALICDGTPADCVALAMMGLLPRKPDLVVSGINLGANLGTDLLYSGTVAAAMEGIMFGVPGVAVSQLRTRNAPWDFRAAQAALVRLVRRVGERGLPQGACCSTSTYRRARRKRCAACASRAWVAVRTAMNWWCATTPGVGRITGSMARNPRITPTMAPMSPSWPRAMSA